MIEHPEYVSVLEEGKDTKNIEHGRNGADWGDTVIGNWNAMSVDRIE